MDKDIDQKRVLELLSGPPIRKGAFLVGALYDSVFEPFRWMKELPYLSFPSDWKVKIIPPFVGAVIRFKIRKETTPVGYNVSVYFDGYDNLGCVLKPYWEVYPANGDTARFPLGQEAEMLKQIEKSLMELESK